MQLKEVLQLFDAHDALNIWFVFHKLRTGALLEPYKPLTKKQTDFLTNHFKKDYVSTIDEPQLHIIGNHKDFELLKTDFSKGMAKILGYGNHNYKAFQDKQNKKDKLFWTVYITLRNHEKMEKFYTMQHLFAFMSYKKDFNKNKKILERFRQKYIKLVKKELGSTPEQLTINGIAIGEIILRTHEPLTTLSSTFM